jgi:hypothetical protein
MRRARSRLKKRRSGAAAGRFGPGALALALLTVAVTIGLGGCASVSDPVAREPSSFVVANHALVAAFDAALLESIGNGAPKLFELLPGGGEPALRELIEASETCYLSVDLDYPGDPEYRVAITGDFPVFRVRLGVLLSRDLERVRTDRDWYVSPGAKIAFTFIGPGLLVAAEEPVLLTPAGSPGANTELLERFPSSGLLLAARLTHPELIADILIAQGVPAEIAREIVIESALLELDEAATEGFEVRIELTTPKALQSRLVGAAITFALRTGRTGGIVAVDGVRIVVSEVPVSSDAIATFIEQRMSSGEVAQ